MRTVPFIKMVASGNDFVVVDAHRFSRSSDLAALARKMCDRKFGAGADGVLLLGKSVKADVRMRIFNADGSEAEMCGNGARCAALYSVGRSRRSAQGNVVLETKAGLISSVVRGENVKVRLTDPKGIAVRSIELGGRSLKVYSIDTGVPHAVIFVAGLSDVDVQQLGRAIRYHAAFAPKGTNVNFVEVRSRDSIAVRTYERGVEGETLACGTGSSASAIIFARESWHSGPVKVITQSTEVLSVYFSRADGIFRDVWLEGKARIVYEGIYRF